MKGKYQCLKLRFLPSRIYNNNEFPSVCSRVNRKNILNHTFWVMMFYKSTVVHYLMTFLQIMPKWVLTCNVWHGPKQKTNCIETGEATRVRENCSSLGNVLLFQICRFLSELMQVECINKLCIWWYPLWITSSPAVVWVIFLSCVLIYPCVLTNTTK